MFGVSNQPAYLLFVRSIRRLKSKAPSIEQFSNLYVLAHVRRRQSASLFVRSIRRLKPKAPRSNNFQIYKVFEFLKKMCWPMFGVDSLPVYSFDSSLKSKAPRSNNFSNL